MSRKLANSVQLILIYGCCYSATLPLIKTAILLDWCRIFDPIDRTRNVFWCGCMAVATLQCVWGLLCIILLNMQCRPHEAIWKFYLPSKCYSLPDVMLLLPVIDDGGKGQEEIVGGADACVVCAETKAVANIFEGNDVCGGSDDHCCGETGVVAVHEHVECGVCRADNDDRLH